MTNPSVAIQSLYPAAVPLIDYELREHQGVMSLHGWNTEKLGPAPTIEELAAYDIARRPGPDWATFKSTALNDTTLNAIVAGAIPAAPLAALSLAPALLRAESQGPADFAAAWSAICAAVAVPAEVIAGFQQVATAYNLPEEFVGALYPSTLPSGNPD